MLNITDTTQIDKKNMQKNLAILNAQIAHLKNDSSNSAKSITTLITGYRDCYEALITSFTGDQMNDQIVHDRLAWIMHKANYLHHKYKNYYSCNKTLGKYLLLFFGIVIAIDLAIKVFSWFFPDLITNIKPLLSDISTTSIIMLFLILVSNMLRYIFADEKLKKEEKILEKLKAKVL